jgi:hypothetical protein
MASADDWLSYRNAVVDMAPPGRDPFRLVPDEPGTCDPWPDGLSPPLTVVTAWNPDSVRLGAAANEDRNRKLIEEFDRTGVPWWPAIGRDLDGDHHEDGFAVSGLTETEARDLGRRHGQAAVFRWTPTTWEVVSCTDDERHVAGWLLIPAAPVGTGVA